MESILKYMLYLMAITAVLSGLNVLLGGAAAVPGAIGEVEATIDNELRFFAVFWVAYGGFCAWVARHMEGHLGFIPCLALVFLFGGIARLLSTLMVGMPSQILFVAMVVEFVLPLLIGFSYRQIRKKALQNERAHK